MKVRTVTLDSYIASLGKRLSAVKEKIITELWSHGTEFPRDWVASSYLLQITEQKYFDRRTRELRDEVGCDIETKHIDGEHHYRLKSTNLTAANPRQYLTENQKRDLFKAADHKCQICGVAAIGGVRGLQADHKKPLIRGGSKDLDNWQAVCNECNVAKRRACQGCEEDCTTCQWAFPELAGFPVIERFPKDIFDELQTIQMADPEWLQSVIRGALIERKAKI